MTKTKTGINFKMSLFKVFLYTRIYTEKQIYNKLDTYYEDKFCDLTKQNSILINKSYSPYAAFSYKGNVYPNKHKNAPIDQIDNLHTDLHPKADQIIIDLFNTKIQKGLIRTYLADLISNCGNRFLPLFYALPSSTHSSIQQCVDDYYNATMQLDKSNTTPAIMDAMTAINIKHQRAIEVIAEQEIIDLIT